MKNGLFLLGIEFVEVSTHRRSWYHTYMQKLIVGNWKSYKNDDEALKWWEALREKITKTKLLESRKIIVAPSFTQLGLSAWFLRQEKSAELSKVLSLASQDLSPFPQGAYTGAVSNDNIETYGVQYAILGHSERRRYFHETDTEVANKIERAVEAKITPIVCIDDPYIESQAAAIQKDLLSKCVVAYEALEAIGTGKNTPVEKVQAVFSEIKSHFGQVPCIYGGSVKPDNAAMYLAISDGVLPGGASLKVESFMGIVTA